MWTGTGDKGEERTQREEQAYGQRHGTPTGREDRCEASSDEESEAVTPPPSSQSSSSSSSTSEKSLGLGKWDLDLSSSGRMSVLIDGRKDDDMLRAALALCGLAGI